MVGRAGHGARWNAGRAEPGRRKVAASHGSRSSRSMPRCARCCPRSETMLSITMKRFFIHHALMHVRWQHRTAYLRNKDQAHWAATLVENVRVGDKMTERYVAYLAGIGERDITRLGAQCGFWERVTRQLDRLSNRISAEDRKRVERVLQERVPCPTRLQYDQWHSEGTRLLGSDRVTPPVENWPR